MAQAKLQKKRKAMKVVVKPSWPVQELQRRIQDKVVQHTARSSDQFRRISQNFSQARNLTPETFKIQIDLILDANIPEAQCMELFRRFDTDGSGDVDLQEFITGIMPKDYNVSSCVHVPSFLPPFLVFPPPSSLPHFLPSFLPSFLSPFLTFHPSFYSFLPSIHSIGRQLEPVQRGTRDEKGD